MVPYLIKLQFMQYIGLDPNNSAFLALKDNNYVLGGESFARIAILGKIVDINNSYARIYISEEEDVIDYRRLIHGLDSPLEKDAIEFHIRPPFEEEFKRRIYDSFKGILCTDFRDVKNPNIFKGGCSDAFVLRIYPLDRDEKYSHQALDKNHYLKPNAIRMITDILHELNMLSEDDLKGLENIFQAKILRDSVARVLDPLDKMRELLGHQEKVDYELNNFSDVFWDIYYEGRFQKDKGKLKLIREFTERTYYGETCPAFHKALLIFGNQFGDSIKETISELERNFAISLAKQRRSTQPRQWFLD